MSTDKENLLKSGNEQINKLRLIVQKAIDDEKLLVEDLSNEPKEILTKGQSISDHVAKFGGSWYFIITFSVILTFWILLNTLMPLRARFDQYPFIL